MKKNFIKDCKLSNDYLSICYIHVDFGHGITIYIDKNGKLYTDIIMYLINEEMTMLGLENDNKSN